MLVGGERASDCVCGCVINRVSDSAPTSQKSLLIRLSCVIADGWGEM